MIVDVTSQVDGVRTRFELGSWYIEGSVRVFVRGLLRRAGDADGWTELGGSEVELAEAPRVGDQVQVRFRRRP